MFDETAQGFWGDSGEISARFRQEISEEGTLGNILESFSRDTEERYKKTLPKDDSGEDLER